MVWVSWRHEGKLASARQFSQNLPDVVQRGRTQHLVKLGYGERHLASPSRISFAETLASVLSFTNDKPREEVDVEMDLPVGETVYKWKTITSA